MLDLRFIRENPDAVRAMLKKRNSDAPLEELLKVDVEWRAEKQKADELRAKRNKASVEVGEAKKRGEGAEGALGEMRKISGELERQEEKAVSLEQRLHSLALFIPNIPHESVPVGASEEESPIIRKWGEPKKGAEVKPHYELGAERGILDFERGAKISGSRFTVLKGAAARLERGLINFMLDMQVKNGYLELSPPLLVNEKAMAGTGQLPKFADELYCCGRDGLYLIPTAEVPLTNMHSGEILEKEKLPILYTAYTPCFRREAGAYGKDIKGMIRQHQFDKIEVVKITLPEKSYEELEMLTRDAESILRALEIPYQVKELCTGDLGFGSAKTYDLEAWIPSQEKYREISSCSNFEAFQARRMGCRYWERGKPEFVHTLNGSGVAVGRALVAIMENFQQPDGRISVPKALRPYVGGAEAI